jgi:hypothetical protein
MVFCKENKDLQKKEREKEKLPVATVFYLLIVRGF